MKDKQGVTRGKCTISGCECTDYMKPQSSTGVRCDYCDHSPVKHVRAVTLGACTKCKECPCYESDAKSEDDRSYPDCEYCDCPARHHENADKMLPKQPNQPTPVAASAASVSETQVPNQDMAVIQAALKCMLPGCDKPCSIQPSGHVHDFCSREHALAYNDAQKKPIVPPKANAPDPAITQSLPLFRKKICTKCGKKPANPGGGWCQDCYTQSSQKF